MNPITHFLAGWTLGDSASLDSRGRAIVTWAGVAPDIDGLAVIPDLLNRALHREPTLYFFEYHHALTHGLPAALVAAGIAWIASGRRIKTAALAFASFHLHLLCDFVGSRGPTPDDIWAISYLQPLSNALTFSWSRQWELNAWPNILFTMVLMALIFVRAVQRGYSPVCLFSARADHAFVDTLRKRFATASDSSPSR